MLALHFIEYRQSLYTSTKQSTKPGIVIKQSRRLPYMQIARQASQIEVTLCIPLFLQLCSHVYCQLLA